MAYSLLLNEDAHDEYIEAYEWYETKKTGLGERFMQCVEKRLLQINEHPEYYSKVKDNFREVKIEEFPYVIVYKILKRKRIIHIVAIYHYSKDPLKKYQRKRFLD